MQQLVSGTGRVGGRIVEPLTTGGPLTTSGHDSGTRSRVDSVDGTDHLDVEAACSHRRPTDRDRSARVRSRTASTDPVSR